MTKIQLRRDVIRLRMEGKSYSQIKTELKVSKGTLSRWLKDYPLSKNQLKLLRDDNPVRIEKFRQTMKKKKDNRLFAYYKESQHKLTPLTSRELFLSGLFLYWGEGGKTLSHTLSINNTDPAVLKFVLYWMVKGLRIKKNKIRIYLHLYQNMDIEKETDYWSRKLRMSKSCFIQPYIKKSKREEIDHKGFGHGTCGLMVYNTIIKEKILMAIKAVSDYIGNKVDII
ncbi:hypothetical protein A3F03_04765 [Candidatus Roizmanbacteria bacterium RIFCSPHIGHO2_12_FULL_41_11]|uniref:Uncharacterized protein n=2 Tax=Candidatus Roizmaniibacteriota TaxID=1752723 RepID=A0A1F7J8A5_9BACT|nr:MAG: hypothetical protein A3F03_04765 [Candidatus Roizmanbacteria bacterium RIFCSPHIGHO2_12_FULL_41_11]OGK51823.1 MAG: hypothetical protein A2966_00360 [Candidatus Roizmanbacteria bacterium RIFCSPLOWO2_01_FULL_41_22]